MKVSGLCFVYLVVGTALMFLTNSDPVLSDSLRSVSIPTKMRKIKEHGHIADKKSNDHKINLDDYSPIDPVPSSKASIKPGPIVHGTPLNPFIPKPSPPGPGHPKNGGIV